MQEERRKIEQETYVNVDSRKKKGGFVSKNDGFGNEYIVVRYPSLVILSLVILVFTPGTEDLFF